LPEERRQNAGSGQCLKVTANIDFAGSLEAPEEAFSWYNQDNPEAR
jgi:hypothetical protein